MMNDSLRAAFAERILDLRDQASMNRLNSVAQHLDKAFRECSITPQQDSVPPDVQILYSMIMADMLSELESQEKILVFPKEYVKRVILTDKQIGK